LVKSPKFLAPAALLLLLSACGEGEKTVVAPAPAPVAAAPAPAAPAMDAPAALVLVKDYLAAWNEHDIDRTGGFLADDVQYFDSSFGGMQHGRQAAVEQGISVFMRGVPDLRWEIRSEPIVSSDGVAYEWTFTGTHTGTWGTIRATNQKINLKGMSFVRIKDGKIAYQAVFYDSAALNRQLGL
jgi:steroid delta-isomerase-like uncharacterized protein